STQVICIWDGGGREMQPVNSSALPESPHQGVFSWAVIWSIPALVLQQSQTVSSNSPASRPSIASPETTIAALGSIRCDYPSKTPEASGSMVSCFPSMVKE